MAQNQPSGSSPTGSGSMGSKNWDINQVKGDVRKFYDILNTITPNQPVQKTALDGLYTNFQTLCQHLGIDVGEFTANRRVA